MKTIFFLLLPLCLFAQKRTENTFDIQDVNGIYIDSDIIFKITINTATTDQILMNTLVDGETYASALIHSNITNNLLEISTGRTPDFTPFNDKLSAHKVLSIELELTIPEDLDIDIRSTLAEVHLKGRYNRLQINLGRGGFIGKMVRFRESVINTISGNVKLTLEEANVTASSRNGLGTVDRIFNHGPLCVIQSIYGDIEVLQVK